MSLLLTKSMFRLIRCDTDLVRMCRTLDLILEENTAPRDGNGRWIMSDEHLEGVKKRSVSDEVDKLKDTQIHSESGPRY